MSVLVDHEIREYLSGCIKPFKEENLNPNSYNISLGSKLGLLKLADGFAWIDPLNKNSCVMEEIELGPEGYILEPQGFILAEMLEKIYLPNNITSQVKGRSSLGRYGLINSSHAGLIDCGFAGFLTMELYNSGNLPIKLVGGMSIGQLEFKMTTFPEASYGERKSSRYFLQGRLKNSEGI